MGSVFILPAARNAPLVVPPLGGSSPGFRLKPVLRTSATSSRVRYKKTVLSLLLLVMLASAASARIATGDACGAERIEVTAGEFHATQYLSDSQRAEIKRTNLLTGFGEAEYVFRIPQTRWYEFWVESCSWSTDLVLDGRFLTHTTFTNDEWKPDRDTQKVLNLYLAAGDHTLRFVRPWPFGLPYMRRFFFAARDATGMVRFRAEKGHHGVSAQRRFPLQLQAGRLAAAYGIHHCPG